MPPQTPDPNTLAYDASGNITTDNLANTYTYDAEGNITAVDGGATASYVYDALNHRVRTTAGSTTTDYVFNANGQRVSIWDGSTHARIQTQYYWGSKPVAFNKAGATHFQHQDWLGTERVRTSYNGAVEASFTSLPFGDGQTPSANGDDAYHFASLDHDVETSTDHAQFRQYSNAQGRWLRPDPYTGSYDILNPQSFNRYVYAMNNPLSLSDWLGLASNGCSTTATFDEHGVLYVVVNCPVDGGSGGGTSSAGGGCPMTDPISQTDRKSTRLNSSHRTVSRMPSSA